MNDITIKMRLPRSIRATFLLLATILFLFLGGCATKSTVIYVPHDNYNSSADSKAMQQLEDNEEIREALREYFSHWRGTRYSYGGLSRSGVDCSGLTLITYKELFGKNLPRTVKEQVKRGKKISKASLQAGDLVFFKTGLFQKHVGIYLEDDLFIHASDSQGVTISSLNDEYWQKRYWQAQRIRR
jgi:cell wall-associated NlpC family hydrolase